MPRRIAFITIVFVALCCVCEAAKKSKGPPGPISYIFPPGGKAGSSFQCTVAGAFTKTPSTGWADHPGIVFKGTPNPTVFQVTIAPEVPPGPHLVRFYNDETAAPPRVFMVGVFDEVMEKEPNDDVHHPQTLPKIPCTINGAFNKEGDADNYSFHAEAGRWIVLALDGYGLGVQMDPVLRLLDEQGVEVAMNHDTYNLDPLIAYQVKKSGTYTVEAMTFIHPPAAVLKFMGSSEHVYRLTITDGPYARFVSPSVVQPGGSTEVKFAGWNFGSAMEEAQSHQLPALDPSSVEASGKTIHVATPSGETVLAALTHAPVIQEIEPNNDLASAQKITVPVTMSGRLDAPKDEDRFRFTAKKGETINFHLFGPSIHSPVDAIVTLLDDKGKELKYSNYGDEGVDPVLNWKATADGEFVVAVRDLYARGGWNFVYALECGVTRPAISATVDAMAYKLEAGKTSEVKVSLKLTSEFKGKLGFRADGLPEGVTLKAADEKIGAKGGEVKLTLSATPEAKPANQPFEVVISTTTPDSPMSAKAIFDLHGVEPRGDRLISESSLAWLTVTGKQ